MTDVRHSRKTLTAEEGQCPAYIHLYTLLHRRLLAETDMQEYLPVTLPSVYQMLLTLERAGLIRRQPRPPAAMKCSLILTTPHLH